MPTHKITLKRPTPVTKLGLTLSSTSENDPPFVKKLVGISEASGLLVGDVVTEVNGTSCASSSAAMQLIARAGAEIVLLVTRDEGSEVHVTLRRGGRSLGLVMDARNVIVELVEESAAAVHGGVHVGDRILSINGTAVAPGENIVSLFPPGEALIALKLLRTQEVRTPQQQRPVDVPFNQQSTSKESAVAGFSAAERAMLREAFVELGGTDDSPISLSAAFVAFAHFRPDAKPEEVRTLCRRAIGREGPLSFNSFCSLMLLARSAQNAAHLTFTLLDSKGIGVIAPKDIVSRLKKLHQGIDQADVTAADLNDDLEAMVAALPVGSDGLVSRFNFVSFVH